MSLGSDSSDRPGKPEVRYFVGEVGSCLLEEHVLAFYVSVNEVFFVNALETLHDFDDDASGLAEGKYFTGKFGLVSEKVALLAVLHDDDDELGGWVRMKYS